MARTGIPRIDALVAGPGISLKPGDADAEAVGCVQELLRCQGFTRLPDKRSSSYGSFGNLTRQSVLDYRAAAGLPASPEIDTELLTHLAAASPPNPLACRGYLTLGLDCEYDTITGLVALTCLFESGGRFACQCLNTDHQGLSFGIIQWAQKPGRLREILQAFHDAEPAIFTELAGGPDTAAGLLDWTSRPYGGVDPATGTATQRAWSLVDEPWKARLTAMGLRRELQRVQVAVAKTAFQTSLDRLRPGVPLITSPRGFAFLLDLANQHGDGGARSIYKTVARPDMREDDLLAGMALESVRRVSAQYGAASAEAQSTANRRDFFRNTALV